MPTREGLDELQASGSAQFSLNQFSALTKALQENGAKDIYIVDLRQENHGFLIMMLLAGMVNAIGRI